MKPRIVVHQIEMEWEKSKGTYKRVTACGRTFYKSFGRGALYHSPFPRDATCKKCAAAIRGHNGRLSHSDS